MTRSLLPPRGIFIPASLIYNPSFSSSAFHTWVKLRGLAWGRGETPPLSMQQLVEITGLSQSSLYRQMAYLRSWGALRWRPSEMGTLIITFESEVGSAARVPSGAGSLDSENPESPDLSLSLEDSFNEDFDRDGDIPDSRNLDALDPIRSLEYSLDEDDLDREGKTLDSRNPESHSQNLEKPAAPPVLNQPVEFENSLGTGKSRRSVKSRPANPANEAVNCYRRLTGIRPNLSQRELLIAQVTDLPLWKASLEHWQIHGWNPKNLAGQIDLYQRGGPGACRYCHKELDPLEQTLANLNSLREELGFGGN